MRRKFWKILGITVALLIVLVLLFVLAFIFNPFEASLPDMRELVPRDTDYFTRKVDLREDFAEFPEPLFWSGLAASRAFGELRQGPTVSALERDLGIEAAVAAIRDVAQQVRSASAGVADLLSDVLGSEAIIAGRIDGGPSGSTGFCAYLRVSWKVRFAWGLLEWPSVREQLGANGLRIEQMPDGTMRLSPEGGQPLVLARWLDCLIVSNDEAFVAKSLELARGAVGSDSFGGSSDYRDGVESRLREWEEQVGVPANAIELYLRPDRLFEFTRWDDGWPDPRHPTDMNTRVLASFLNLNGWRFLTGSLIFERGSFTVLGRVDLNRNKHTGFQSQFFKTEAQDRKEWLEPFLTMVPETACAAAALRVPAGDFLQEMLLAIDEDLRRQMDQTIQQTGKFDSVAHVIDAIRPALLPRTGFVFHRAMEINSAATKEQDRIETFDPSPSPHFAWVFWIDPRFRNKLDELYAFLTTYSSTLGFSKAYNLPVQGGAGGDAARELANPNIPGTGEIALMLYGNFFVVSNSGPLIRKMVLARLEGRNVLGLGEYATFEKEMAARMNGFVFLQGERLAEVADDHIAFTDSRGDRPDEHWMLTVRPSIDPVVLRDLFPSYRSPSALTRAERERFDAEVMKRMEQRWQTERTRFAAAGRAAQVEMRSLFRLLGAAFVETTLDPQWMAFKARVLLSDR